MTAGGIPRSRTKPRTAPSASVRRATFKCTRWSARAPWRRRWTSCWMPNKRSLKRSSVPAKRGSRSCPTPNCTTCWRCGRTRWRADMGWRDYGYYPPSRPKRVKGGIQARSVRGAFGSTWWGKRWTAVLEDLGMGARLGRGRSYARHGQVLSIDVEPGVVRARVQGSYDDPYEIEIRLRPFGVVERAALAQ